jgi:subtilase family serine protease
VTRQLAFAIDPDEQVAEDDETDNRVTATVCLYPAGDSCSAPCE